MCNIEVANVKRFMTQGRWSGGTADWFSATFSHFPRDSELCSASSCCRSGLYFVPRVLLLLLLMSVSRGCCQISVLDSGGGSGWGVSPKIGFCIKHSFSGKIRKTLNWIDNNRETCKRNVIHFYLLVGFLRCLQDGFCSGVSVGELKLIRVQRFMALLAILSWDLKTTPLSQNNLDKIDIHQPSKACLSSWHWWRWWWRWWRGGWWPGCCWTASTHWHWQS